jgi:hypothetical protein
MSGKRNIVAVARVEEYAMPDLLIHIKKKTDGSASLSCTRADGTVTWQRQDGQLGAFFPLHDLTHYVVETVLEFRRAFYGLLAEGWDLSDFGKMSSKGPLPDDARLAELIVGFFDLERATGILATADDFNEKLTSWHANNRLSMPDFRMTDEQVGRIREERAKAFARWKELPAGNTLELPFERSTQSAA